MSYGETDIKFPSRNATQAEAPTSQHKKAATVSFSTSPCLMPATCAWLEGYYHHFMIKQIVLIMQIMPHFIGKEHLFK